MNTRSILSLTAAVGLALSLSGCIAGAAKQFGLDGLSTSEPARKVTEINNGVISAAEANLQRGADGIAWGGLNKDAVATDNKWAGWAIDKALDEPSPNVRHAWNNPDTRHQGYARIVSEGRDAKGDMCRKAEVSSELGLKETVVLNLIACKRTIEGWVVTGGAAGKAAPGTPGATVTESNDAMPRTSSAANVRAAQQYTAGTSSADYSHVAQNVHTALTSPNLRSWPWNEPSTGHTGSVEATRQYSANGLLCRAVVSKTNLGRKQVQTDKATYCQTGQDTWTRQ